MFQGQLNVNEMARGSRDFSCPFCCEVVLGRNPKQHLVTRPCQSNITIPLPDTEIMQLRKSIAADIVNNRKFIFLSKLNTTLQHICYVLTLSNLMLFIPHLYPMFHSYSSAPSVSVNMNHLPTTHTYCTSPLCFGLMECPSSPKPQSVPACQIELLFPGVSLAR